MPLNRNRVRDLFVAEQTLLMVRVAADTGARRGELAALQIGDLDGRVLRIERGCVRRSAWLHEDETHRRITMGTTTVAMISAHVEEFAGDPATGHDWLFAPDASRSTFARSARLKQRFDRVRSQAGVEHATLHRFRHSVATYLVGKGRLVSAQYRLGHGHTGTKGDASSLHARRCSRGHRHCRRHRRSPQPFDLKCEDNQGQQIGSSAQFPSWQPGPHLVLSARRRIASRQPVRLISSIRVACNA